MYLEEVEVNNKNLEKILYRLETGYGTTFLLYNASPAELISIYEKFSNIKHNILKESHYNSYLNNPDYTKALLICEAIRLFLSEVAPERKGKKVVKKKKACNEAIIQPEMPDVDMSGGESDNYSDDAPTDFDGTDHSDDYSDDRKPNTDGKPLTNFDYEDTDSWIDDKFLIEPETGDDDDSSEFSSGEESDAISQEVANRYYDTPGPDASDYADDRNIEAIDNMMDGPGHHATDVIDKILSMPDPPGEETKTGLPSELEDGVKPQNKGDRKNGVVDNDFHQEPRHEEQRDIPKPTDLQKENNKKMYEVHLAQQMIKELNRSRSIGKLYEAASRIALDNKVDISKVLTAFEFQTKRLLEYKKSEDRVYQDAMLYALDLIGSEKMRDFLLDAQKTADGHRMLMKFLINKANDIGLTGSDVKKFTFAVLNSILNTDLSLFNPGKPVWENKR